MKRQHLIILFILIIPSILLAQIPREILSLEDSAFNEYFLKGGTIPLVRGKIINMSEDSVSKIEVKSSIVTPFEQFQIQKVSKVNRDGTFEVQLDYSFPYQQIWIQVGDLFYTGVYANKDLFIELDANKIKSQKEIMFNGEGVKYLGTDGDLNTFVNNHILFQRDKQLDLDSKLQRLGIGQKLTYDVFLTKYDSLYAQLFAIDSIFQQENPSEYGWIIKNERRSNYLADLCTESWGKEMNPALWEKVKNHKSYFVSNEGMLFYKYILIYVNILVENKVNIKWSGFSRYSQIDNTGRQLIDSISFIEKLQAKHEPYDTIKFNKLTKKANVYFSDSLTTLQTLNTIEFLDSIFPKFKSDFLKIKLGDKDPHKQKLMYDLLLTNMSTKWCREVIEKENKVTLEKLNAINNILKNSKPFISRAAIGKPIVELSFGAKLFVVDSIKAADFLANLKGSFKDKALIIDFWATWCSPCLQEMPYSKKLHDNTKELPVEFVYLCTSRNSNIEKWKAKIAEFELSGTHFFVNETIESDLMSLFSASGFPSYIFIDKNGNYKPGVINRMSNTDKNKVEELVKSK
jgi:thiol-disulfide isomerase/thioredoxin